MNFSTIFSSFNKSAASTSTIALPVDNTASSFCSCCGVDVAQFNHEFWCRLSTS
ncbi:unnamed protein product [Mucor hiemalis]